MGTQSQQRKDRRSILDIVALVLAFPMFIISAGVIGSLDRWQATKDSPRLAEEISASAQPQSRDELKKFLSGQKSDVLEAIKSNHISVLFTHAALPGNAAVKIEGKNIEISKVDEARFYDCNVTVTNQEGQSVLSSGGANAERDLLEGSVLFARTHTDNPYASPYNGPDTKPHYFNLVYRAGRYSAHCYLQSAVVDKSSLPKPPAP